MDLYYSTESIEPTQVHASTITPTHIYFPCDCGECAKHFHKHGNPGQLDNRTEHRFSEHTGKRGKPPPAGEEVAIVIDDDTVRKSDIQRNR